MAIIIYRIYIMTNKIRSKKSTTKKYKQKRGGDASVNTPDIRGNVGPADLQMANELKKEEIDCDKAIAEYTPFFGMSQIGSSDALGTLGKMKTACKPICTTDEDEKECQISLNPNHKHFFKNLHSKSREEGIYDTVRGANVSYHSTNPTETSTPPQPTETPMSLTDSMFVLPCLQEREQLNEKEQQSSIITNSIQNPMPSGNKVYYDYWYDKDYPVDDRKSIIVPKLLKDAMPSGKISLFRSKPTCRKFTTAQKWEMYGKWAATNLQNGGTALIVTHHNRMRGLSDKLTGSKLFDLEGGILPINNEKNCNAYANNFCFRIHYDPNSTPKITTEIAFQGFPDKGGFPTSCNNKPGCTTGGGENYNYCCPDKDNANINTKPLETGLINANITKPITFYVIRHGNSIHNKPIGKKFIDSCLTPLGLYQAKKLGCFLKDEYKKDFNGPVILGTSFLCRTQLTGLAILNEMKAGGLNKNLLADYDLLKKVSLNKFKVLAESKGTDLSEFNGYAPIVGTGLELELKGFYEYCCAKLKIDNFVPNNDKPKICNSPPSDLPGGGKNKKQTRKNRRKKK